MLQQRLDPGQQIVLFNKMDREEEEGKKARLKLRGHCTEGWAEAEE